MGYLVPPRPPFPHEIPRSHGMLHTTPLGYVETFDPERVEPEPRWPWWVVGLLVAALFIGIAAR